MSEPNDDDDVYPECGCGLWICRDCRPEEFEPGGRLYRPETPASGQEDDRG